MLITVVHSAWRTSICVWSSRPTQHTLPSDPNHSRRRGDFRLCQALRISPALRFPEACRPRPSPDSPLPSRAILLQEASTHCLAALDRIRPSSTTGHPYISPKHGGTRVFDRCRVSERGEGSRNHAVTNRLVTKRTPHLSYFIVCSLSLVTLRPRLIHRYDLISHVRRRRHFFKFDQPRPPSSTFFKARPSSPPPFFPYPSPAPVVLPIPPCPRCLRP